MSKVVYLVTGANRGIGREIVRQLAMQRPQSVVILASRVEADGKTEADAITKEIGPGKAEIVSHQLDVTNDDSVKKIAEWVKSSYGGLDVLINNAGYAIKGDGFDEEIARTTAAVNYFGVKKVTEAFLPIMRPQGRIITVSSSAGILGDSYSAELKKRFLKEDITVKELDELAEEFFVAVRDGVSDQKGWPRSTYKVSKALVNGYIRNKHRETSTSSDPRLQSLFWAALCPGWIKTRMAPSGPGKVEDGADTPVWLATTDEKLENGRFWKDRKQIDW